MTDRELLELAAKAAGIPEVYVEVHGMEVGQDACGIGRPNARWGDALWNPLTDDGDALRLAVKLRIDLEWDMDADMTVEAYQRPPMDDLDRSAYCATEELATDRYAATRRAIVRAAAEMAP